MVSLIKNRFINNVKWFCSSESGSPVLQELIGYEPKDKDSVQQLNRLCTPLKMTIRAWRMTEIVKIWSLKYRMSIT